MKKFLITCIVSLFIMTPTFSQTEFETRAEKEANRLLSIAREKLQSFKTMEINFTYELENTEMDIKDSREGTAYFKDDKYRIVVGHNILISDGETTWNYLDDFYELHINTIENTEGMVTPNSLLENFEDEYKGKFIRQEPYKRKTVDLIDLVPNEPGNFFKYRVALDAKDQDIVYTIAYDRSGTTYTYTLQSMKTNQTLSDDLFTYNPSDFPDDIDIVDMR